MSVITVQSAYEELESQGLISSRQGLGTFVYNAVTTPQKHFESQFGRELIAIGQRASAVGISKERLRALSDDALCKGYDDALCMGYKEEAAPCDHEPTSGDGGRHPRADRSC